MVLADNNVLVAGANTNKAELYEPQPSPPPRSAQPGPADSDDKDAPPWAAVLAVAAVVALVGGALVLARRRS